jgi:hypothetical protein
MRNIRIKLRKTIRARHIEDMKGKTNTNRMLDGKSEGIRPAYNLNCIWEENIKICLKEMDWLVSSGFIWFTAKYLL